MRTNIPALTLLSVLLLGGCATLIRGPRQTLEFRTIPTGAQVKVDGRSYVTPVRVSLARKDTHDVVIKKWGYRTLNFTVDPQWDGISLVGNIIMPGGSAGIVVDRVVGSDRMFYALTTIRLIPSTQPDEPPIVLNDFKGHLLTDSEVASDIQAERRDRAQFFRGEP
jgi:hypothetical protein